MTPAEPTPFPSTLGHLLHGAILVLLVTALASVALKAQGRPVVTLGDLASAEVRQQGFTLPRAMKVHVYARGAGARLWWEGRTGTRLFASGWILNAATREVVWQMDGANGRRTGDLQVTDQYLDLPAGSYEAYFADYGFGENLFFSGWIRNIDRRHLRPQLAPSRGSHSLLGVFGLSREGAEHEWLRQVGQYGMQVSVPAAEVGMVETFPAPLRWRNILFSLAATDDNGHWVQAFRLRRPVTVHLYAEGEGSGDRMVDTGWIQDARTRQRVWEMSPDKAQYAGGASKNRQVDELVKLPKGAYTLHVRTDDSHAYGDWNAGRPWDAEHYGATVYAVK